MYDMLTDSLYSCHDIYFCFAHIFQLTISEQPIEKMSNTIEPQAVENINKQQQQQQLQQPEEIRVEVVQEEDTEEILNMLKTYFFKVKHILLSYHKYMFLIEE